MWWKKNKWKVIVPVLVLAVLAGAFWYGGGAPGLQGWSVSGNTHTTGAETETVTLAETDARSGAEPVEAPEEAMPASVEETEPTVPASPEQEPPAEPETGSEQEEGSPEEASEPEESSPEEEVSELEEPEESEQAETTEDPEPANEPTEVETQPADEPTEAETKPTEEVSVEPVQEENKTETPEESSPGVEPGDMDYSIGQGMEINPETGLDRYSTEPVPEGKPLPVEPENAVITDEAYTCTISISCAAILDHMDWLDPEKVELVPEDGWILAPVSVTFYNGESVFNVLQRTCKQNRIHMEFSNTPIYNSAYIEGIHNLYEFDCGNLSGWMYAVNGWYPNYGCSRYQLKDGDVIEWKYTCDLGKDIGGFYAVGG